MKPTRFFALGGLQEIGKTTLVVEYADEIVIVDAGIKFTNSMETGVDGIIPDYSYLKKNQAKIKGLFITHGHEDHIGGIPYLLQQVVIPKIYAPRFAIEIIKMKLKDKKVTVPVEFEEITRDLKVDFEHLKVDFWTSQHSIPDSFGVRVRTPNGNWFDTGDFRFDYTPIGNLTDFSCLEKWGQEGVDIFISDSTNSLSPDHSPTEQAILVDIEKIIKEAPGKVFLTTFASNMNRVKAVIDLAAKHKRRVCPFGRSMVKLIEVAKKIKFIDVQESTFVDKRDLASMDDKEILVLSTGSQGEEMAALNRIANGKQNWVSMKLGDIVIFSSSPIPGNAMKIEQLINQLYKVNASVKENKIDGMLHTSGHAYKSEHVKIFNLIKPKYFIPYHGQYRQQAVHGVTANEEGVKLQNIFNLANGQVVELRNHRLTLTDEFIDPGPIYIDSGMATKATSEVIKLREHLGQNGFINVVVNIDRDKNEIIGRTKIISRGALYVKENAEFMKEVQKIAHGAILYIIKNNQAWTKKEIKELVARRIINYFNKLKRRRPLIITSILTYNLKDQITNMPKIKVKNKKLDIKTKKGVE